MKNLHDFPTNQPQVPPARPTVEDRETRVEPEHTPTLPGMDGEELGTPYLGARSSQDASERWQQIQAEFVDDPRRSVQEAHTLVSELMKTIVNGFTKERSDLEHQWSSGAEVSTEDLRLCLHRYRSFFERLLPAMGDRTRH